jgi:hypothetical protein
MGAETLASPELAVASSVRIARAWSQRFSSSQAPRRRGAGLHDALERDGVVETGGDGRAGAEAQSAPPPRAVGG